MRIARFEHDGSIRLGVVHGEEVLDLGAHGRFPVDVAFLLESPEWRAEVEAALVTAPRLALSAVRLLAPLVRPPEFLAVGLNYADHIAETAQERPTFPKIFNKQISCIVGPTDPIVVPREAPDQVDYEGELGVVIGRRGRNIAVAEALTYVAGYLVVDDVSVRDWQRASPTMTMGKSWDTHGPIGPWLVTTDEIPDPQALRVRTWVDDELRQDASTGEMLNGVAELIAFLSKAMTLLPGTIIATGTPAGVGAAMTPPGFVRAGQSVRIEIDGIGTLRNPVVAE